MPTGIQKLKLRGTSLIKKEIVSLIGIWSCFSNLQNGQSVEKII